MRKILLLVVFFMFCVLAADTFSIQGVLRDPLGKTVEDGSYNLTFRIYEVDEGGTDIWEEEHLSVPVSNGVFGVELGNNTSLDNVPFNTNYWIGFSVNHGPEMYPRFKMVKSPVAMSVYGSDNVFPSIGNVGIGIDGTQTPEACLHIESDDENIDRLKIIGNDGNSKLLVSASGNVGVNCDSMIYELEIDGDLKLRNGSIIFPNNTSLNDANLGGDASGLVNDSSVMITFDADGDGIGSLEIKNYETTCMQITGDSDVYCHNIYDIDDPDYYLNPGNISKLDSLSIGHTEDPQGKLDVRGDGVKIWDGDGVADFAANEGDLYVGHCLEVDGIVYANQYRDNHNTAFLLNLNSDSRMYSLSIGHENQATASLDVRRDEVRIWNGSGSINTALDEGDLYVQHDLEVDSYALINELHVESDMEVDGHILFDGWLRDAHNTGYLVSPTGTSRLDRLTLGFDSFGTNPDCKLDVRGGAVRIWDGTATVNYANGQGDLFVEDNLEVDGDAYVKHLIITDHWGTANRQNARFNCQPTVVQLEHETSPNSNSYAAIANIGFDDGNWYSMIPNDRNDNVFPERNVLRKLLELNVIFSSFERAEDQTEKSLGFIGSEVNEVYPELVTEKDGQYFISAMEVSVAAIAAIQELHEIVESQGKQLAEHEKLNLELMRRLEALENK